MYGKHETYRRGKIFVRKKLRKNPQKKEKKSKKIIKIKTLRTIALF